MPGWYPDVVVKNGNISARDPTDGGRTVEGRRYWARPTWRNAHALIGIPNNSNSVGFGGILVGASLQRGNGTRRPAIGVNQR